MPLSTSVPRDFVDGVVCLTVEEVFSRLRFHLLKIEFMDVVFDDLLQIHPHRQSIGRWLGTDHTSGGLVHLGAAVAGMIDVGIGTDVIDFRF